MMPDIEESYCHTQRAPLCLIVYATTALFIVLGWVLWKKPLVRWIFPTISLLLVILAASFHQLTVEDDGDRLSVSYGPIRLFRRSVQYEDIVSVEIGRTTILDGWGIHMSFRGGWVWNLWGRDCVVLRLPQGILRIGTDDAETHVNFLDAQLSEAELREVPRT